ncbi:AMP-binding protein [Pseudomonas sp. S09G 359]|jgi:acyl-CoA synthetase (AMP-forming)/AMP-acid ligase II/acyl carrier protein|uniref:AMP-binding protein n=1 Tax=Pseudomonas sp. S09G 359 TaxID=2054919 RepID=UPI000C6EECB2|nr:AMP-binding protein [Pseudomonas sp. S09G 359]AUG08681.1 AMP-dependent synthetase [Pseudomonas sp. S09G 359]
MSLYSEFFKGHTTLIEAMEHHESNKPDFIVYHEISPSGDVKESFTYAQIMSRARALAKMMYGCTNCGDRVLILVPGGADFVVAFLSCLLAGLVAVPCYPIRGSGKARGVNRNTQRVVTLTEDAKPSVVLCDSYMKDRVQELGGVSSYFNSAQWILVSADTLAEEEYLGRTRNHDIALLQYTSGSTATPKGVMVSQANLVSGIQDMEGGNRHDETSVMITWIPVYHDMGLVYGMLTPLYLGFAIYSLLPAVVLQQPVRWLQAVSKYRGTHSAAPNFAYELCINKITQEMKEGLDLRSWVVASNGAEPVRPKTLFGFHSAFAGCGLGANVVRPGYGLAEATLKVSSVSVDKVAKTVWVDNEAYARRKVVARQDLADSPEGRRLQSCGGSNISADLRIVDPVLLSQSQSNEVGEIWVKSTSVAMGYWNQPELTKQTFGARLDGVDGVFLRTGDLGFVHEGELYVSGRINDVIIVNGQNIYPQDLELTVENAHPALRAGRCCAFGMEMPSGEKVVVVVEIERSERHHLEPLVVVLAIQDAVGRDHEVVLEDIILVRSGTFPLTSSGKVQRAKARAEYLAQALECVYSLKSSAQNTVERIASKSNIATLRGYMLEYLSDVKNIPATSLDCSRTFNSLGLDSIEILELTDWLGEKLRCQLPSDLLVDYPSIDQLSYYLAENRP